MSKLDKRILRMKRIGELHKNQELQAGRDMARVQREQQRNEQTLDQLESYEREYLQQFSERAQAGLGPEEFRNFQLFCNNLHAAVSSQQQTVKGHQEAVDESRDQWLAKRQATDSMGMVTDQLTTQRTAEEEALEQRESEERPRSNRNKFTG